jgi:hypothetical protein
VDGGCANLAAPGRKARGKYEKGVWKKVSGLFSHVYFQELGGFDTYSKRLSAVEESKLRNANK